MTFKRIIPCLDVKNGKVVKGIKFKNLRDVGHPSDLALEYERQGADEVALLDISASLEARPNMLRIVERTAGKLSVPLTVGGGIKSKSDMRDALEAGADKVSVSSAAVLNPDLINECAGDFGRQCVVVAIDVKRIGGTWTVHTHGGTRATELDAIEWAQEMQDRGAGEILLTSMDADGTKDGYDIQLTGKVADAISIPVIASGGCGSIEHIHEVFAQTNASAALAASIFHYQHHTVQEVKEYLKDKGIPVR